MRQVNYDGHSLVTGTQVAVALTAYADAVARMSASVVVEVPVLEANGAIGTHNLLLNGSTALESFDVDCSLEREDELFPVPAFPGVGGSAVAVGADDFSEISVPIGE